MWWYGDSDVGSRSIVIKRVLMVFIWCCVQTVGGLIVSYLNRVGLVV